MGGWFGRREKIWIERKGVRGALTGRPHTPVESYKLLLIAR